MAKKEKKNYFQPKIEAIFYSKCLLCLVYQDIALSYLHDLNGPAGGGVVDWLELSEVLALDVGSGVKELFGHGWAVAVGGVVEGGLPGRIREIHSVGVVPDEGLDAAFIAVASGGKDAQGVEDGGVEENHFDFNDIFCLFFPQNVQN